MKNIRASWLNYIQESPQKPAGTRSFQDLLAWLDTTDYWSAPASTRFHSSFEGGLAYHSLKMAKILQKLTDLHQISWKCHFSPLLVSMLHDLCKVGCYKKELKSRKVLNADGCPIHDPFGKPVWENYIGYTFDNSDFPMGHGAKSVILASRHVELTPQEEMCIFWHMGVETDSKFEPSEFTNAITKDVAVLWTHVADRLAALEEVKEAVSGKFEVASSL